MHAAARVLVGTSFPRCHLVDSALRTSHAVTHHRAKVLFDTNPASATMPLRKKKASQTPAIESASTNAALNESRKSPGDPAFSCIAQDQPHRTRPAASHKTSRTRLNQLHPTARSRPAAIPKDQAQLTSHLITMESRKRAERCRDGGREG